MTDNLKSTVSYLQSAILTTGNAKKGAKDAKREKRKSEKRECEDAECGDVEKWGSGRTSPLGE